ncbi:fibronectin type III domain-containing protein [Croceivirga thetidis]|uniref:Fibronectin type III domain-containing protein n=1 Tax=Croceivirga thetidis TaxID=2721623 RepID=A0ABX1GRK5_9FLAO|nr:fibronectin type III domain-containing protein [Croceivirga thetidis]NKI32209.1 fibronectin type III domain-containing protein [Croceivirga thetidis]
MKHFLFSLVLIVIITGCSSSESPEEMEVIINLPSLTTNLATEITENSVTVGGNITSDGGASVTERGVVWSTRANPTTSNNKQTVGNGTGSFSTSIVDLDSNTNYFIRAYAINSEGTAYGSQQQFTTLEPEPVQKIFDGDVILTSQQQVDDFGAEGYTEITGNLEILDGVPADLTNLLALNGLKTIGGDIRIGSNRILMNLNGLETLMEFAGELTIESNSILNNIEGLQGISGNLSIIRIDNNPELKSLSSLNGVSSLKELLILGNTGIEEIDFPNLEFVEGAVIFSNNDGLVRLGGFNSLISIGFLNIEANDQLTEITGFNSLIENDINGIFIGLNESLNSISGFESFETLRGSLTITTNTALIEINFANNLKSISNLLVIDGNSMLNSISGFTNLESVEEILINSNFSLQTIEGFESLVNLDKLTFRFNSNLLTVIEFPNLERINEIEISGNGDLSNLDFMSSVTEYTGEFLNITDNVSLVDFCGLNEIISSGWDGEYNVSGNSFNPLLQDLRNGNCN